MNTKRKVPLFHLINLFAHLMPNTWECMFLWSKGPFCHLAIAINLRKARSVQIYGEWAPKLHDSPEKRIYVQWKISLSCLSSVTEESLLCISWLQFKKDIVTSLLSGAVQRREAPRENKACGAQITSIMLLGLGS